MLNDELVKRMQAFVLAMAKECPQCHHIHTQKCEKCWCNIASAIKRDMEFTPISKEEQEKYVLFLRHTDKKMFTTVSQVSIMCQFSYKETVRLAKKLAEDNKIEFKDFKWVRRIK